MNFKSFYIYEIHPNYSTNYNFAVCISSDEVGGDAQHKVITILPLTDRKPIYLKNEKFRVELVPGGRGGEGRLTRPYYVATDTIQTSPKQVFISNRTYGKLHPREISEVQQQLARALAPMIVLN